MIAAWRSAGTTTPIRSRRCAWVCARKVIIAEVLDRAARRSRLVLHASPEIAQLGRPRRGRLMVCNPATTWETPKEKTYDTHASRWREPDQLRRSALPGDARRHQHPSAGAALSRGRHPAALAELLRARDRQRGFRCHARWREILRRAEAALALRRQHRHRGPAELSRQVVPHRRGLRLSRLRLRQPRLLR